MATTASDRNSGPAPVLRLHRGDPEAGPEAPEALFLSSLIELGEFTPDRWGITEDHFECWQRLYGFAVDYQVKTGSAPPIPLVRRRFPDFEITPDVDPRWAADQLRQVAAQRDLRRRMRVATTALTVEDTEGAFSAFDNLTRPRGAVRRGLSVFDHVSVADELEGPRLPVPYQTLQGVTKGIGAQELWLILARFGVGKTYELCHYTAEAVKTGAKVTFFSLEMPGHKIARRVQRAMAGSDQKLLGLLDSVSRTDRHAALDKLAQRMGDGGVTIVDAKSGPGTVTAISDAMSESDLVVIDHISLMRNPTGAKTLDDWINLTQIADGLHHECVRNSTPVLAASQANRQGESPIGRPPKLDTFSRADQLGAAADVIVSVGKPSQSVRWHSAEKVREGPNVEWYTRFEPVKGRFGEITKDVMRTLIEADESRAGAR